MILDDFKERMKSAYEIINQLNCLIQVEKSVWLAPKYDNTLKDKQSNLSWDLLYGYTYYFRWYKYLKLQ